MLRSNVYEKASDLAQKYEELLETVEREHADKVKTSEEKKPQTWAEEGCR